jgi:hypothetical protein
MVSTSQIAPTTRARTRLTVIDLRGRADRTSVAPSVELMETPHNLNMIRHDDCAKGE